MAGASHLCGRAALGVIAALATAAGDPAAAPAPLLHDATAGSGLTVITWSGGPDKNHILESTGNGVLALDYDGDGDQDLYFVNAFRLAELGRVPEQRSTLYRNEGGLTFLDVTDRAGVGATLYGHGGCVGDADGDGLPDLYLTAFGANRLYRNRGDGTFSDATPGAGVGDPGWSIGATFFDADRDGDQDLYVANYIDATWDDVLSARRTRRWRDKVDVMDGPRGLPESANTFYRNDGGGRFVAATEAAGLAEGGRGYSMGVASFDADGDGDPDLYVANDSTPNRLYRNRGDGSFAEVGAESGVAYNAEGRVQGSMGIGVGDYDGDGRPDLAVTNFAHDNDALYRNLDGALFQDDSFVAGLAVPTFVPLGWAAVWLDADNDGDLDLFVANGHIYPQVDDDPSLHESYRQTNQLLLNEAGRLRDASAEADDGLAVIASSRGAAAADLDNDGDTDLAVSNQDALPTLLEARADPAHHWIALELGHGEGGVAAIGAELQASASGRRWVRQILSGGSYASQNDLRAEVGLGAASSVDEVSIRWPDGRRQRLLQLPADRFYRVPGVGSR
jgi:enediyne biosynthesis protein E4